ncbi:hypothetical protein SB00610_03823 [Klebsiella quasipneumoniae subsp. similipneumoniae]|nr:hypothetical protein SB00610_03823 [Klebsiella quasipneumoniae subsp. similipneumoniae]
MIVAGDKAVGFGADHHTDVAGGEKGVDTVVRLIQQTAQGRQQGDVLTEKEEVFDVALPRLTQGEGGGGHGGFETKTEKDHLTLRVLLRQPQGVHRRVNDANIGAAGFRLQQ